MGDYTRTLTQVAEIAVGVGDEHDALEQIAAEAAGLFSAEMACIFRYEQEKSLKHLVSSGIAPHLVRKLEEADSGQWADVLISNSPYPVVFENAKVGSPNQESGGWANLLDAETVAVAQILSDGKPLGVLVLFHYAPHKYVPQDCDALQTLAALCSVMMLRSDVETRGEMRLTSTKSQLFSVLSHELRTPLTSIMGFTQLIRKRLNASGNSDHRLVEQLDVLWAQAQRLNRLIDTFVDMARIERGEFEITQGQVELNGLLRTVARQTVAQASSRHLVNVDAPGEPLWMHGDNKRLEQVFSNIISNAVRYSPQGQAIEVRCQEDKTESMAVVEITDKGPGIPAARLRDVFDRNYPSGPLKAGGLGVGLYLSKVIVEAHGGQIAIRSAPDRGTTVRIELPV